MLNKEMRAAASIMVVWSLLVLGIIFLAEITDYELFFVIWFNGLLGIIVLINPHDDRPSPIQYLRYLAVVGMVLFAVILGERVLEIFN